MLRLVLYLLGNNNQQQQRVGKWVRQLRLPAKTSPIWSDPSLVSTTSLDYTCHISQSPTDYKHKHIHTMITCGLLLDFMKHPAKPFFFFFTCSDSRSRSDKAASKLKMCSRLCSCQSLWGAVMVCCADFFFWRGGQPVWTRINQASDFNYWLVSLLIHLSILFLINYYLQ